jgi:hypothetical protein
MSATFIPSWPCPECLTRNPPKTTTCEGCGAEIPTEVPA